MLEKVDHTIGVKDMPAREARASLSAQLLRVADRAHGLVVYPIEVANSLGTGCIETRQAFALIRDTFAGMPTCFMGLITEGNFWLIILLLLHFLMLLFILGLLFFFIFHLFCVLSVILVKLWSLRCFQYLVKLLIPLTELLEVPLEDLPFVPD